MIYVTLVCSPEPPFEMFRLAMMKKVQEVQESRSKASEGGVGRRRPCKAFGCQETAAPSCSPPESEACAGAHIPWQHDDDDDDAVRPHLLAISP